MLFAVQVSKLVVSYYYLKKRLAIKSQFNLLFFCFKGSTDLLFLISCLDLDNENNKPHNEQGTHADCKMNVNTNMFYDDTLRIPRHQYYNTQEIVHRIPTGLYGKQKRYSLTVYDLRNF
jgi:hypothetical protein